VWIRSHGNGLQPVASGAEAARRASGNVLIVLVVAAVVAAATTLFVGAVVMGAPLEATVVALTLALLPLVVTRPALSLGILVALVATNASAVVGERAGIGLYVLGLALVAVSVGLGYLRGRVQPVWSPVFLFALLFLAVRAFTILNAVDPGAGMAVVIDLAKELVMLAVVTVVVVSTSSYRQMAAVATGMVALLAGLSLAQEFLLGGATSFGGFVNTTAAGDVGGVTVRHTGPYDDPNFWARTLVLFLPVAAALAAMSERLQRLAWGAAGVLLLGGLYLTQSRGGLLAAAGAYLLARGRRHARVLLLAPLLVVPLLLVPGVGSRLATLADLTGVREGRGDGSLVQRSVAQEAGLAAFLDNPATGVGAGGFETAQPEYARRLGLPITDPIAPHNLYLQMATEGGLLGIAAWLLFFGAGVFVALRALLLGSRLNGARAPNTITLLAAAVLAAMAGWALASVFLHLAHFRALLFLVGLGAALDVQARRAAREVGVRDGPGALWARPLADEERQDRRRRHRLAAIAAAGVLAVTAPLLGAATGVIQSEWTAAATASVVPGADVDLEARQYSFDLLSRDVLMPTFAQVVANPRFHREAAIAQGLTQDEWHGVRIAVDGSPRVSVLSVEVRARTRDLAERMALAVLEEGRSYLNQIAPLYIVEPPSPSPEGGGAGIRLERLALAKTGAASLLLAAMTYGALLRRAGAALGRSQRPHQRARRLRPAALVLGIATLSALLLAALAAVPLLEARSEAAAGAESMQGARDAASSGDLETAGLRLETAQVQFERAEAALGRAAVRAVGLVPVAGRNVAALQSLTDAGATAAGAMGGLVQAVLDLPGGVGALAPADGRIPIDFIRLLHGPAADATGRVEDARARLPGATALHLPVVRRALAGADVELGRAAAGLHVAAALTDALPDLLGETGSRRYFLVAQNPAELRGTGGFMGAYTILTAQDGRLDFGEFGAPYELADIPIGEIEPPNADYAARYNRFGGPGAWPNINATPDFPSAGSAITSAYAHLEGVQLDGVIAVDPFALQALLRVTGTFALPPFGAVGSDEVVDLVTNEAYAVLEDSDARKEVLGAVATGTLMQLLADPDEAGGMEPALALAQAARGRHVMLYAVDPALQSRLAEAGLAGGLPEAEGDFLGVFTHNAGENKLDYFAERAIAYDVQLRQDGSVVGRAQVALSNRVDLAGQPEYVTGDYEDLPRGAYAQMLSVYCAQSCLPLRVTRGDELTPALEERELDHPVVSTVVTLPRGGQERFRYEWVTDDAWRPQEDGRYRLTFRGQPMVRVPTLDLTVRAPAGFTFTDGPPGTVVDGTTASWSGPVGASEVLEFGLRRS
jgi:hypothetical protein